VPEGAAGLRFEDFDALHRALGDAFFGALPDQQQHQQDDAAEGGKGGGGGDDEEEEEMREGHNVWFVCLLSYPLSLCQTVTL
jgi:calcium-binding protein CML